jgi:purine nucleosidase
MRRLVIDTDAGVDDAIAILLALADPSVEVLAFTTVHGNVPVAQVTQNVGRVLDAVGAGPIPIFQGAARPLVGPPVHATEVHGADGLGDAGLPATRRQAEPEPAPLALARLARAHAGELLLVALGPLTNIALALALEPELPRLLRGFVWMGGAIRAQGNTTAVAEFNAYADPEAAASVFEHAMRPLMVPWETVLSAFIPWSLWDRLVALEPVGQRVVTRITARVRRLCEETEQPGMILPDAVAMAAAVDPSCAQRKLARVEVETGSRVARGLTAVQFAGPPTLPVNAEIVTEVRTDSLTAMLRRAFTLSPEGVKT